MIELQNEMPKALAEQVMVQEQLGFALNRSAVKNPSARAKALKVLDKVEKRQGANSETCGLIGRIYKDQWSNAVEAGLDIEAAGHLDKAIAAYLRGFMADQRDAYPGINAVTLLEIKGDAASLKKKKQLAPVVLFAVERRLECSTADYWDYATMLELAVIDNNPEMATEYLGQALASVRESFEPETTKGNLQLIAGARKGRGEVSPWLDEVIDALQRKQNTMV